MNCNCQDRCSCNNYDTSYYQSYPYSNTTYTTTNPYYTSEPYYKSYVNDDNRLIGGQGGFLVPFGLGLLSGPLVFGPRPFPPRPYPPRPYPPRPFPRPYGPYPYY